MDDATDFISINGFAEEELDATHADLSVTVKGSSLFTGVEALKKAREVAALASELHTLGVTETDIRLDDITADTASGLLSKSSGATYSLNVRVRELPKLGDVVGVVVGQKNCTLGGIVWGFDESESRVIARLSAAAAQANARAKAVADALGVQITGVHRFREIDAEGANRPRGGGPPGMLEGIARRRMTADDLGLVITHKKKVRVEVSVNYRVAGRS